ncbi:MAG: VWA-like domain-containing protein [Muribaculaceae bacterium]
MTERISEIAQQWFLSEEALFVALCSHRVTANHTITCPIRVGKGLIEFNPELCSNMSENELDERLRVEVIRILLKHPYERQPDGCSQLARALGSNCVIADSYPALLIPIEHPSDFNLPGNGHFEFYARQIQNILPPNANSNGDNTDNTDNGDDSESDSDSLDMLTTSRGAADIAATWQHDELMTAQINEAIRNINSWGSLPGNVVEQIIASTTARINYRNILAGFRASIISQARRLTRMRPNRRSGFEQMGSRYNFTTSLIIGVDVSGSISTDDLRNFYTTINHFFQYGIEQIDVVQFDTQLGKVETISEASESVKVTGRGGTNFQPFIDFVAANRQYDGAIIYTDGYALPPTIPPSMTTPLCWILRSEGELAQHQHWMCHSGRVCVIENN